MILCCLVYILDSTSGFDCYSIGFYENGRSCNSSGSSFSGSSNTCSDIGGGRITRRNCNSNSDSNMNSNKQSHSYRNIHINSNSNSNSDSSRSRMFMSSCLTFRRTIYKIYSCANTRGGLG